MAHKFNIYTIYNKLSKRGEGVNLAVNDEIADRQFKQVMKEWKERGVEPSDFILVRLGEIDLEMEIKEGHIVSKEEIILEKDGKREKIFDYKAPIYSTRAELLNNIEVGTIPPNHDGKNTGDEVGLKE